MYIKENKIDPQLTQVNATQLAQVLGVTKNYITRMKQKGFAMPGGRCSVNDALTWRKENPNYLKYEQ